MRKTLLLVIALVVAFSMTGCDFILDLLLGGNSAPTVDVTASAYSVWSGDTVTITASASDADGDVLSYAWRVDGVLQAVATSGMPFNATVSASTSYNVSCTVSDGVEVASDSVDILVSPSNHTPTVSVAASATSVNSDEVVTLTATASDSDGDFLTYAWRVDGALQTATTSSVTFSMHVDNNNTYAVSCTVSDGSAQSSASVNIFVISPDLRVTNVAGGTRIIDAVYLYNGSSWSANLLSGYIDNGQVLSLYNIAYGSYVIRLHTTLDGTLYDSDWVTLGIDPTYYLDFTY